MADRHDVIIAGAGPVGLIAALKMAREGIEVLVVDKLSSVITAPRALGYQWPSPRILEDIGVLDEAIEAGLVKTDLEFRRPATGQVSIVSLTCLEPKEGEPAPYDLALGQDVLANIIVAHLEKFDNAQLRWNCEVTGVEQDDNEVRVSLATEQGPQIVRGSWLIGADGSRSEVRDILGLSFEGYTWPDRFVATNVYYDFAAHGYGPATFVSDPKDWTFIIQINDENLWRVTYGEDASLPEESVRDRMGKHFDAILPDPSAPYELASISAYQVHEKCASSFRVGRVLLAGDAAHICNPSGGQGLLGGIYDANALAVALIAIFEGKRDESVLDAYAEERKTIFLETTSPQATRFKAGMMDPEGIAQLHGFVAKAAADPNVMRTFVSSPMGLVGTFPIGPGTKLD